MLAEGLLEPLLQQVIAEEMKKAAWEKLVRWAVPFLLSQWLPTREIEKEIWVSVPLQMDW